MAVTAAPRSDRAPRDRRRPGAAEHDLRDPRYQAYSLLRVGFVVAPIAFGIDKFFNLMVDWPAYLAPWVVDLAPGSAADVMHAVGAIEILAGLLVALRPRVGAWVVAAWLGAIIVGLLTHSGFYDVALRDFGLMLGALALALLASVYDRRADPSPGGGSPRDRRPMP